MSRFWPKSLAGQIACLVAIALLVAQAINFGLLLRERDRQILLQISSPTIARLADAIERDKAGQDIDEPVQDRRGSMRFAVFVDPQSRVTPEMLPREDVAQRAHTALGELGFGDVRVIAAEADSNAVQRPGRVEAIRREIEGRGGLSRPYLLISAQIADGRWVTSVSRIPPRDARVIGWLLVQTLILYGIVLIPVLWAGRRIARPLGVLTGAVESFRSAENSVSVPESGPHDVRRLITAYNGMRTRIASLLDEKDRMLGAIGHDLRTPLASLRVRAEGMDDDNERERMAATIDEMNRTLDDILSLARLGRPSEAETKVDLGALLDSVVDDFLALGADVTLDEGPRITATLRPTLIIRAVRNLIDNAIKYAGGARVSIGRNGDGVEVLIDDRGPGIPSDRIEDMFEPFARMEESRSRETGGSGLGLALAKAIALQHGGRLTLENRDGGGLTARLWLPTPA